MPPNNRPIILATRGSALALTQTNLVLEQCRAAFPHLSFEIKIIKTTGDKLQSAPPDLPGMPGTKGLFTKELELALLNQEADFAVHSLKDLPTELPEGLELAAVLPRADVRDVLIYRSETGAASGLRSATAPEVHPAAPRRGLKPDAQLRDFPTGAVIATSSTRRQAQLLAARPDLKTVPIRGNVGTRLQKLAQRAELDGIILAAAGLKRLGFEIAMTGGLTRPKRANDSQEQPPDGLLATYLGLDQMLPCVGQGAIGLEARQNDARTAEVLTRLNDPNTWDCVIAERAFLQGMGGGCMSPVGAYAEIQGGEIRIRAVSFRQSATRRSERTGPRNQAANLGNLIAADLKEG